MQSRKQGSQMALKLQNSNMQMPKFFLLKKKNRKTKFKASTLKSVPSPRLLFRFFIFIFIFSMVKPPSSYFTLYSFFFSLFQPCLFYFYFQQTAAFASFGLIISFFFGSLKWSYQTYYWFGILLVCLDWNRQMESLQLNNIS